MAKLVNGPRWWNLAQASPLLIALICAGSTVHAAPAPAATLMADPTLPPPGYGPTASHGTHDAGNPDHATPADPLRVQMIVRRGKTRYALIDGKTVHAGDSLPLPEGTARVERIEDDTVQLRMPGAHEVRTLYLNGTQADTLDIHPSGAAAKDALEKR